MDRLLDLEQGQVTILVEVEPPALTGRLTVEPGPLELLLHLRAVASTDSVTVSSDDGPRAAIDLDAGTQPAGLGGYR